MAARLLALQDDGVAALPCQPMRFLGGRRADEDARAGCPHAGQQRSLGQAEMEADDLRPHLLDDGAHGIVERAAQRRGRPFGDAFPRIIGSEQRAPGALVGRIRQLMALGLQSDPDVEKRLGDYTGRLGA